MRLQNNSSALGQEPGSVVTHHRRPGERETKRVKDKTETSPADPPVCLPTASPYPKNSDADGLCSRLLSGLV